MSTVTEQIAEIRGMRDQFLPPEVTTVMDRAIADLAEARFRSQALKVGDKVPDFTLPDVHGQPVSIGTYLQKGPVVLSFHRGSWCLYCNISVHGLAKVWPEVEAAGASLLSISPELPGSKITTYGTEHLDVEKTALPFPFLADVGNIVAKQFGLVYTLSPNLLHVYEQLGHPLPLANGETAASELPLPATYIVDTHGVIRFVFVDEDYAVRYDPANLPALLRSLSA